MASNAERLDALYDGFWNHGDWHSGADIMAPDIEWIGMPEDAILGGTRYGPKAVNKYFTEWLEAWDATDVSWEIAELTPDLLLVRTTLRTHGRGSGLDSEAEIGQVWEFADGKAVRQTIYRRYEDAETAAEQLARANAG